MVRARTEISLDDGAVIRVPADMPAPVVNAFVGEYNDGIHREATQQPAPTPRQGVQSIQAAVRDDLLSRERLGIERYGTPLQPHNGRDGMLDLYEELLDACCYAKQVLTEREGDSGGQRIDGDLLSMFIVESCPRVLTQGAAEETAERTLAELAGIEGVTIVRGPHGRPWKPESVDKAAPADVVEAHICCEHAG